MKKSKKLISLLLALVMLLSIIPMAAAADAAFTLGTTKLEDAELERGTPSAPIYNGATKNAGSTTASIGETKFYQSMPIYTYGRYDYSPVNYMIPENGVQVSTDGVIDDLMFTLEMAQFSGYENCPALQFEYTAKAIGSTKVTLTYYYNFGLYNPNTGIYVNNKWYKGTMTFTVTVDDSEITKPGKPNVKGFYGRVNTTSSSVGAVYMWCADNDHSAWFDYVTDVSDGYTLGEVKANDGSVKSKVIWPWVCEMTIDANKYLDAYNYELGNEYGTHYLADGEPETQTVTWYYNSAKSVWQYISSEAPIYIDITHTAPTPEVKEFTVTYTDGVENEEVFADQTYTVKEGDATPAFEGEPTREGYKFLGWEPAVAETVTGNAVYVATWEAETYTITYDFRKVVKTSDVKNLNNPATFTVEDLPLTLKAPTFKNNEWPQKFLNWRDADGNVVTEITEPGDITLYAYYQYPVRYRVYDEDGKEVEALTVIDWYDEDDFATYKVRPATVDMPGCELDGWYQNLKDAGNVNKRFGSSLYMAKKYELVGKLSYCINVTVMVDGEVQATQKYTGPKGTTPDYNDIFWNAMDGVKDAGKVPQVRIFVDGKENGTPVFGSSANVVVFIYTKGTISASGDDFIWDDGEGNESNITATIPDMPWDGGDDSESGITGTIPDMPWAN